MTESVWLGLPFTTFLNRHKQVFFQGGMFVLWACGETPASTAPDSLPASSTHCFLKLRESSGTETETMAFHKLCLQVLLLTAFLSYCAHSGKNPSVTHIHIVHLWLSVLTDQSHVYCTFVIECTHWPITFILYICDWVYSQTNHMYTVNLQVDAFKCHSMLPRDKIVA